MPAPPLVELDRITVHLGGRPVLHDLSWSLRHGEQWAVVGPNGSGKSTLLQVIRGDRRPLTGTRTYALDGAPQPAAAAARLIGFVSPEHHERTSRLQLQLRGWGVVASGLFDTTYVAGRLSDAEVARVEEVVDRLALRDIAERPVEALSFGQMRMLLIARAVVREPRVLVLDECTNGLDAKARVALLAFLERVAERTHVIASSHRYGDLPAATTHHAVIAGGRIVEAGTGLPHARRRASRTTIASPRIPHGDVLVEIRDADVYRGERRVLRGVAWSLRRGAHTAIRGANGAGKSTFARLVAGTLPAAYGAAIVRFGSRGPFDVAELRRRIAHVSDELQIAYEIDPPVEQVVASGFTGSIGTIAHADGHTAAVNAIAQRLGIADLLGRRFGALSFGERRKVLIARGLVHRPEILILDEIWSGLDATFRAQLHELLDEHVAAGTTLLTISHHDDDLPEYVRRTCTLEDGVLVEEAS